MPYVNIESTGTKLFYSQPTCTKVDVADGDVPKLDSTKPTLLFINCTSLDSRAWAAQFEDPLLNDHFNILTVDMHFTGLTKSKKDYVAGVEPLPTPEPDEIPTAFPLISMERQSEDLAELIRRLQLPQVHLISEADNNFYSYYLVMKYPEMCKSIITLSPAALAQTDHNRLIFADMWNSFVLGREAEEVMNGFFSVFFGTRAHHDRDFKEKFFTYWASVVEADPALRSHYFAQWICALCRRKAFEIEDVRKRWTVPTCLASGADYVVHPTAHGKMEEILGDSACPLLESHHFGDEPTMISMTVSGQVNDMISRFVARVEGIELKPRSDCKDNYNADWKTPYQGLERGAAAMLKAMHEADPSPQQSVRIKAY